MLILTSYPVQCMRPINDIDLKQTTIIKVSKQYYNHKFKQHLAYTVKNKKLKTNILYQFIVGYFSNLSINYLYVKLKNVSIVMSQ